MFKFHIQLDGEIPASVQLYNQIRLAIASNQFPPGYRLPSTRQLAMITGLHRNTINKVYRQLEEGGFVESLAGSGFYVKSLINEQKILRKNIIFPAHDQVYKLVQTSVDKLLNQGVTLNQARELFLAEIDWRWLCSSKVIVTAPLQDLGIGELMLGELNTALNLPIELIALENLAQLLDDNLAATIITNRYFLAEVETITKDKLVRIIPIDIYDYSQEINIIKNLSPGSCAG
ncbi:MAG TPA: GntR family transcriptional regulator, partial [Allocoleopsis sp.]